MDHIIITLVCFCVFSTSHNFHSVDKILQLPFLPGQVHTHNQNQRSLHFIAIDFSITSQFHNSKFKWDRNLSLFQICVPCPLLFGKWRILIKAESNESDTHPSNHCGVEIHLLSLDHPILICQCSQLVSPQWRNVISEWPATKNLSSCTLRSTLKSLSNHILISALKIATQPQIDGSRPWWWWWMDVNFLRVVRSSKTP